MIEQDTIRLLRECDAGIKMGVESIDEVLEYVGSEGLSEKLSKCKAEHEKLNGEVQKLLDKYHDEGKDPNPIAKGMSWMKTNVKLSLKASDHTIADLITDGCNMGVKSLTKYLEDRSGEIGITCQKRSAVKDRTHTATVDSRHTCSRISPRSRGIIGKSACSGELPCFCFSVELQNEIF